MAPTGQWYGRTFTGLPPGSKKLALTYDDGPNDPHTLRLLEVLAKHEVHATFFLIGRYVKQRPDIARAIAQAGHAIGNHTFSHPNLIFASARQTRTELQECEQVLYDAVGQHSRIFRPPFGGTQAGYFAGRTPSGAGAGHVERHWLGLERQSRRNTLNKRSTNRFAAAMWSCYTTAVMRHFGADRSQTVLATDRLIARYKAEGYEFVTVPEMMGKAVLSG